MTICRASAALFSALVFVADCVAEPLELDATPVPLHEENESFTRIGELDYLGGLRLSSSDPRFGGLSGLAVSSDGRRLSFVTDAGSWIRAIPRYDPRGRLIGLTAAEIGPLLRPGGQPLRKKRESDAESLSRIRDGLLVSFEHDHRFLFYGGGTNPFLNRPILIKAPPIPGRAARNRGIEAATYLPDGRVFAVSENVPENAPHVKAWVRVNHRWRTLAYERTTLFHPTGAATLPDGDVLILERRFTYVGGFAARLVRLPAPALRSGKFVSGQELARLEPPLIEDNFEGVDVWRDGAGRTLIYLISDDNFFPLQRTILLLFSLRS